MCLNIPLNDSLIILNFSYSSGIILDISTIFKTGSKYNHKVCTFFNYIKDEVIVVTFLINNPM